MPPPLKDRDQRLEATADAVERARRTVAWAKGELAQAKEASKRLREDSAYRRDTCERVRAETKTRMAGYVNRQQVGSQQWEEEMATFRGIWRAEPNGVLAAEIDGFRLVVQAPKEVAGLTRFLVLRQDGKGHAIIGSGSNETVQAAMEAAVKMAGRLLSRPLGSGA